MKRLLYLMLFVVAVAVGLTFGLKNHDPVTVRYYFDLQWIGPLSVVLLVAVLFGSVIGFLCSLPLVIRLHRQLRRTQRDVRKMEQEITNLRSLPIKDVI